MTRLSCDASAPLFWRGEQKCLSVLEPIYRRAMENARSALGRVPSDDKESAKREEK